MYCIYTCISGYQSLLSLGHSFSLRSIFIAKLFNSPVAAFLASEVFWRGRSIEEGERTKRVNELFDSKDSPYPELSLTPQPQVNICISVHTF